MRCGVSKVLKCQSSTLILTRLEALRQILDGQLLVLERGAVLVVQPTELLQHLRMVRVLLHDTFICVSCADVLKLERQTR